MKEFYFREEEDELFEPDVYETTDEREILITQIKNTLLTDHGNVIGAYKFGGNIWNYLYEFRYNKDSMLSYLTQQIKTYSEVARGYDLELGIKRIPDERFRDAGIIDVKLNGKSYFGLII